VRLKKNLAALSFAAAFALTGCVGNVSYPTIEPLTFKPSGMAPTAAVEVDSLTPTFKWRCPDPTEKDDLAIWRLAADGSPGETFIFKRNILGGQYTLEDPLTPGEEYFWSVKSSASFIWAKANYVGVSPLGAAWQNGLPFKIKAPLHGISSAQNVAPTPTAYVPQPTPNAAIAPAPTSGTSTNTSSYAAFEPYVGGTWSGSLPPDSDGLPKRMERSYTWLDNKEGIKIEGTDYKGDEVISRLEGLIVWNAAKGRWNLQATVSNGTVMQNTLYLDGDTLVSEISQMTKAGDVFKGHGRLRLMSPNVSSYEMSALQNGELHEVLDIRLERPSAGGLVP